MKSSVDRNASLSASTDPIPTLHGLIVAGGGGTRLWPISRTALPKQFLTLGNDNKSLLQNTYYRLAALVPPARIIAVTSAAHKREVQEQVQAVAPDFPVENILGEPVGRDSAPAVLWGVLRISRSDPDAVIVVVWSDAQIQDQAGFEHAVRRAAHSVRDGGLAAVGITPDRPATNFGYIQYGEAISEGVHRVTRFVEKPGFEAAQRMLAEGSHVWNAGIFVFKARTLLEEYERHVPQMVSAFRTPPGAEKDGWNSPDIMRDIYSALSKGAIDYLVLEKTKQLYVVPAKLGWSDIGTWDEFHRQSAKDNAGNVVKGNAMTMGTQESLILAGKRLVAAIGVHDLIIVDTEDALLVCDMKRAQDVKMLVDQIKASGRKEAIEFATTHRPWGTYTLITEGPNFKVKELVVRPHQKLSLQSHSKRAEHWVVVMGRPFLTCGEDRREFVPGQYLFIPQGAKHRIENPGNEPVHIFEVQTGSYLGEEDIIRYEDIYGRS